MAAFLVDSPTNITLIGGGEVSEACLKDALMRSGPVIAADGGADSALAQGVHPDLVIGDMDSLSAAARVSLGRDRLHEVAEQDSTDFEKCLTRVRAPLVFGVGFLGKRLDHQLAVLNVMVRYTAQRCVLIGAEDVVFAAPAGVPLDLDLPEATRVSLFPLACVTGVSQGLRWPIAGLVFEPSGQSGTSNEVSGGPVKLRFDGPGMVVILPRQALSAAVAALGP